MRPALILTLTLPVLLSACQIEGSVETVQVNGTTAFIASDDGGDAGCIRGLSVRDTGADAGRYSWAIVRENVTADDPCVSRVEYGVVPDGFTQTTAPAPIEAGRTYEVRVKGPGWDASGTFSAR